MEIVDITYREYTTDGRFVASSSWETYKDVGMDDIKTVLETNEYQVREVLENFYLGQGLLKEGENLKDLFKTNISVRSIKTGRFMKWSDL